MSEPVVSDEDFAAEPLLLPRLPGIPAPEFLSGRHADLAASRTVRGLRRRWWRYMQAQ